MATVNHWEYTQYDGSVFYPGTSRTLAWGPWPFAVKGIVVTAHPFDLSTAYRALTVTDIATAYDAGGARRGQVGLRDRAQRRE
jgi:hypothetical protein